MVTSGQSPGQEPDTDSQSQADELKTAAEKEAEDHKENKPCSKPKTPSFKESRISKTRSRNAEENCHLASLACSRKRNLERKAGQLESKEASLIKHEKEIDSGYKRSKDKEREADNLVRKQLEKLEQLAGLSSSDAKDILLQ